MRVAPEPVDVVDARGSRELRADVEPVLPVITEVVPAERLHGHRVASGDTHLTDGRGGGFRGERCADQDAVLPVAGFVHERRDLAAPAAEHQRADRHAAGVFGVGRVARVAPGGHGETGIRMRRRAARRIVRPSLPVEHRFAGRQALPPGLIVGGERDVGE